MTSTTVNVSKNADNTAQAAASAIDKAILFLSLISGLVKGNATTLSQSRCQPP
jgi:hypothetical protein